MPASMLLSLWVSLPIAVMLASPWESFPSQDWSFLFFTAGAGAWGLSSHHVTLFKMAAPVLSDFLLGLTLFLLWNAVFSS